MPPQTAPVATVEPDDYADLYEPEPDRLNDVLAVLDRWHDEHHGVGRRDLCHDQPCRDVTTAATG